MTEYVILPVPSSHCGTKTQSFRNTNIEPVRNVKALLNYQRTKEWKNAVDRNGKQSRAKGTEQVKKARSIRRNGEKTVVIQAVEITAESLPVWEKQGYDSYNDYIQCRVHRGKFRS